MVTSRCRSSSSTDTVSMFALEMVASHDAYFAAGARKEDSRLDSEILQDPATGSVGYVKLMNWRQTSCVPKFARAVTVFHQGGHHEATLSNPPYETWTLCVSAERFMPMMCDEGAVYEVFKCDNVLWILYSIQAAVKGLCKISGYIVIQRGCPHRGNSSPVKAREHRRLVFQTVRSKRSDASARGHWSCAA